MSIDNQIVHMILNCSPKKIAPKVILPATDYVVKQICNHFKVKSYGKTWRGEYNNILISVVPSMVGAPAAAITMEALSRSKVEYIVRVDYCGGLTENIEVGDIILCPSAICGDGTTPHYLRPENKYPQVFADSNLTAIIKKELESNKIDFKIGPIWSHDALFREPLELIEKAKAHGAIAIDMETAVIFALGDLFKIPTASIMIVTDNLFTGEIFTEKITIKPRIFQNLDVIIDHILNMISSIN